MGNQADFRIKFDEYLDSTYEQVLVAGNKYPVSLILPRVDPVEYNNLFDKWFKNENIS